MTATATRPEADATSARVPPRRRRRWLIAAVVLTVLAAAASTFRPGTDPGAHAFRPLDDAVRGTYLFDDGEHLTLWGNAQAPSYELAGRVTGLMAHDTDHWASMGGEESLSVVRDERGAVLGVTLERPDRAPAIAVRDPLHGDQEVRISSDGAELAGTLLMPAGAGPHPAIVFVHGAERGHRHGIYRLLGSHLARRGVAVLIYDKRGVGDSTGSHAAATFDDLTTDALAGVDLLAAHPDIDPARIGVLGFSQGGWVAADAAQRNDDVAFVIAFSASGFPPGEQQAWLHGSMLAARGFDSSGMVVADRVSRMLYSSLDLVEAGVMPPIPHVPGFWFHSLDLHMDTAVLWESVSQPVLAAWGALDCQVPAHDSMEALGSALRRGGNTDVTLTVLPEADHSFHLVEPCGHETGLAHHGAVDFADGYLDLAADWINGLVDSERPPPVMPAAARPESSVLDWHLDPPAPAPWYGTIGVQLATLVFLLSAFGIVAGRWAVAAARGAVTGRPRFSRAGHLTGTTALVGLAATVTGFAAFAEIAILGGVHAAFLVGGPTVEGTSLLMSSARLLVTLTGGLGLASVVAVASSEHPPSGERRARSLLLVAAASVVLVAWAAYWRLLPLL